MTDLGKVPGKRSTQTVRLWLTPAMREQQSGSALEEFEEMESTGRSHTSPQRSSVGRGGKPGDSTEGPS